MRAVRRFYFYLVTIISLELVLWGVYALISNIWNAPGSDTLADLMARGLSQVLIGFPIFILHWRTIQHDYQQDPEEKSSIIRAIFFYALRLATLIPVYISSVILLRCFFMGFMASQSAYQSYLSTHKPLDSLTNIVLNVLVWIGTEVLLRMEWKKETQPDSLHILRRIYRYVWMILGIGTLVSGIQLILANFLSIVPEWNEINSTVVVNGITMILVATPVWIWTWQLIRASFAHEQDRKSAIRLITFLSISLISLAVVLSISGMMINYLLQWILGKPSTLIVFVNQYANLLATLIPFTVLYAYYRKRLSEALQDETNPVRQKSLLRFYATLLSFAGNALTFLSIWTFLVLLADSTLGAQIPIPGWRIQLCNGLAELAIGLPLWLRNWSKLQMEAQETKEVGQHARRSVVRKTYLYLIIFAAVIGIMSAAGLLIYTLVNTAMGKPFDNLMLFCVKQIFLLGLIAVWLIYHQRILRQDSAGKSLLLEQRYAEFPVLILEEDDELGFYDQAIEKIQRHLPKLSISRSNVTSATMPQDFNVFATILLSGKLMAALSEKIHHDLQQYSGQLLVIPGSGEKLTFIGAPIQKTNDLIKQLMDTLQTLAEGDQPKTTSPINGWAIVGYGFGALLILYFLMALFFGVVMR
jgi:hypothetical protein